MAPATEMRSLHVKTRHKIALASAASALICRGRSLVGLGTVVDTVRAGFRWRLDLREGIDLAIYVLGQFERNTIRQYRRHVTNGAVVLDIGANVGAHTLPLARFAGPRGQVFAFEPTHYAYAKLCANLSLNPDLQVRVRVEQIMLTASGADAIPESISSSWPLFDSPGRHTLHGGVARSTDGARIATLDSYVEQQGIRRVDFVKLDVDGHECAVLDGAAETLKQFKPIIAFEIAPYALEEHGTSLADLLGGLRQHGYVLTHEDGSRPLPDAASLGRMLAPGTSINALALPGRSSA